MKITNTVLASLFILCFGSFAFVMVAQSTDKTKTNYVGECGVFDQYYGGEVGATFHKPIVVQCWIEISREINKTVSGGVNLWHSVSTKENPSFGTEQDTVGFVAVKGPKGTVARFEAGRFFVKGPDVWKLNVTLSKSFKLKSLNAAVINSTSFYRTTNPRVLPAGFINKTKLAVGGVIPDSKWRWDSSIAIGTDKNPFLLGPRNSRVAMGFVTGELSRPINKNVSFFVRGGASTPLAGKTNRHTVKWGGVGVAFSF